MKQWITFLAATAIFTACTKQDLQEDSSKQNNTEPTTTQQAAQDGAFVSSWEQYNTWTKTDDNGLSKYGAMRKTPELGRDALNGGAVLSYAKFSSTDPAYSTFAEPSAMPFYFIAPTDRPNPYTNYFSSDNVEGNIQVSYGMPTTTADAPVMGGGATLQTMKFQHVVLTKRFLEAHGLNAQTVKNYAYNQVMALVENR